MLCEYNQVLNRFVTQSEIDVAYYDCTGVDLEKQGEYRDEVNIDFDLFKKIHQS